MVTTKIGNEEEALTAAHNTHGTNECKRQPTNNEYAASPTVKQMQG